MSVPPVFVNALRRRHENRPLWREGLAERVEAAAFSIGAPGEVETVKQGEVC